MLIILSGRINSRTIHLSLLFPGRCFIYKQKRLFQNHLIALISLFIIITLLFAVSVFIRSEWFGRIRITWLTGSTLLFVENWLEENPFKIFFLQLQNPNSIEFPRLSDRGIYLSYPVGTIFPIYIISLINSGVVSPTLVMGFNLLNQYLISLSLSFTIFLLLGKTNIQKNLSFLSAVFSGFSYIFLPGNLYIHQNVYYSDMAVILPFVIFICIEMINKYCDLTPRLRKQLELLQYFFAFYGALCDYLFLFVGLFVFLKRLALKEFGKDNKTIIKNIFFFSIPFIAAISTLVIQMIYANGFNTLFEKFLFRAGLNDAGAAYSEGLFNKFWIKHIGRLFGGLKSTLLIFASIGTLIGYAFILIYQQWRKKSSGHLNILMLMEFTGLILLPCLAQVYFFNNHSAIHWFSAFKFSVFFSTVPFILIPSIFCLLLLNEKSSQKIRILIISVSLIINAAYIFYIFPDYKSLLNLAVDFSAEEFINQNTTYEDIVFSPNYAINKNPPQNLAISRKRVYKANSIDQIYDKVGDLEGDYMINIFIDSSWSQDEYENDQSMALLMDEAENIISKKPFLLYQIPKEVFMNSVKNQN